MNAGTAQQYARWIGVLYIVTIVTGGWGESHVPNTLLIANDVAGTAQRVAASLGLFRASFAAYLIEAACENDQVIFVEPLQGRHRMSRIPVFTVVIVFQNDSA